MEQEAKLISRISKDKSTQSAARKIQFWYQSIPKYFVKKSKKGDKHLTPEEMVKEHLASSLYRLIGVNTPDLRIATNDKVDTHQYFLLSKVLNSYRDLSDCLKSKDSKLGPLDWIDSGDSVDERTRLFHKAVGDKKIWGKEKLLLAAIWLQDFDVLGAGLANIGLIETVHGAHLIKIDPGDANLTEDPVEFKTKISRKNPLLHELFEWDFINKPGTIAGNKHLLEFFADISKEKLIDELQSFSRLSDEEIGAHVLREAYLKMVPKELLDTYLSVLIERKNHLSDLLTKKEKKIALRERESSPTPLQPVFTDALYSESLKVIAKGNARPVMVQRLDLIKGP